jgi:hypothetical protein
LTVSKNQNSATILSISNTTANTLANPTLQLISDTSAGQAQVFKYSSSRNTYKTIAANDFGHYNATAGDISFLNDVATGRIKFAAGGASTVQMTLFSTGNFAINTTTDTGHKLTVSGSGASGSVNLDNTLYVSGSRVGIGTTSPSSSLHVAGTTRISGSFNTATSGPILTVIGSGSAQPIFTVQGSQGELFSITDSLSGSLFSVNDISGLPILEVFSDNTTLIGNYQDPMLITTAKVVTTSTGSFTIYSLPTASYDTAFFEYSVRSGSNARAGSIMAMQLGTTVNFTETTTTDFGSTTGLALGVFVTGSNMILTGSATTTGWTVKTIVRGL